MHGRDDQETTYFSNKSSLGSPTQHVNEWWTTVNGMDDMELRFKDSVLRQGSGQRSRGRAAVIDVPFLRQGGYPIFSNPEDLAKHLEYVPYRRRLVILEDLSRDWIEVLGPALNIPANVFALHYAKPDEHILGNVRIPLGKARHQHFILTYKQPLPIKIHSKRKGTGTSPYHARNWA